MSSVVDEVAIRGILGGISIPSCPAILSQLMAEAAKDDVSLSQVAALVSRDVALAAGVMKVASSSLFGMRGRITGISQALNFLGMRSVLNLVTGELLRSALSKGNARLDRFWDGSLFTAQVCQKLSQHLRLGDPQTAYLFGLFHDCAIPVLMQRFPDYVRTLQDANNEIDKDFTLVEDERHGTNHGAVGYMLAKSWGLPDGLSQAILLHHDYQIFTADSGVDPQVCRYVALGALAERAVSMQRRMVEEGGWVKAGPAIAGYLGMDDTEMIDLFEDISGFVAELSAVN